MENVITKKRYINNVISIIGILDREKINSLIKDLDTMMTVLENQSNNLINETNNIISTQSQIIDHNCLMEIEDSISRVSSSLSNESLLSVKSVLSMMDDRINELEQEIRSSNIDKFNEIYEDKHSVNKFIEELKAANTSASILFNGDSLRQDVLDLFVTQDSDMISYEKDKMISMAITYLDLAVKKYDKYITKIQNMIDVVENARLIKVSCEIAKSLIFSYGKEALLGKTVDELESLIILKLKELV